MVGVVHRCEPVVGAIDKPGETLARPCGQVVVVDEEVMSHSQLGDGNLLIMPSTTHGVLEVEADHLVLVLGKELLHSLDGALHRYWLVRVHHREGLDTSILHHAFMLIFLALCDVIIRYVRILMPFLSYFIRFT